MLEILLRLCWLGFIMNDDCKICSFRQVLRKLMVCLVLSVTDVMIVMQHHDMKQVLAFCVHTLLELHNCCSASSIDHKMAALMGRLLSVIEQLLSWEFTSRCHILFDIVQCKISVLLTSACTFHALQIYSIHRSYMSNSVKY